MDGENVTVRLWWATLSVVSIVNIAIWFRIAAGLYRDRARFFSEEFRYRRLQLWLSLTFALVCAFRSFLPRIYTSRICLVDSWLSSAFIGRALATVAELGFIAQTTGYLRETARRVGSRGAEAIAWAVLLLNPIAQGCCWYGVLTTHYLGQILEHSIWTFSVALLLVGTLMIRPGTDRRTRRFLWFPLAFAPVFLVFEFTIDLPKYLLRLSADEKLGRAYLPLGAGLRDMIERRTVSFDWQAWHTELAWLAGYFTVAVWLSLSLVRAPLTSAR